MSTLTESDEARRECCRTVADTSASTVARLTRERDEARAQVAAVRALLERETRRTASPWIHVADVRRALES